MDADEGAPNEIHKLGAENMSVNNQILFTGFNQNQGCFACGTENGFKIFNSFPFKDSHKRSKLFKKFSPCLS